VPPLQYVYPHRASRTGDRAEQALGRSARQTVLYDGTTFGRRVPRQCVRAGQGRDIDISLLLVPHSSGRPPPRRAGFNTLEK